MEIFNVHVLMVVYDFFDFILEILDFRYMVSVLRQRLEYTILILPRGFSLNLNVKTLG